MRLPRHLRLTSIAVAALAFPALPVFAGTGPQSDSSIATSPVPPADTRYGPFGLLDSRSQYGLGIFPEPFLVDDSDLEVNEFRLDILDTRAGAQHADLFTTELEKGFGPLTLELELLYERDVSAGVVSAGVDSINPGARVPVFQFVSDHLDTTVGVGAEVALPVGTSRSRNTEVVPKVFDDLIIGDSFTLQSIFGYSTLFGPGPDRKAQHFESGFVFGYAIQHRQLPLPDVEQLIPVFELKGETAINKQAAGRTGLVGDLGFRTNLKAIGRAQPRLGFAFVFPMNDLARRDQHWGTITSLVFDF
ncbi:MAG: hypothetical protein JOZ08_00675 [Verrucomicrobia bacterium]|nr:hypothetical protein [Verrucomicrobiota bacterium]MBV8273874.1 hypothetical protein [Verrucomicrobiota bacterium]